MNQIDAESRLRGLGNYVNNYRPPVQKEFTPIFVKATNTEPLLKLPEQMGTRERKACGTVTGTRNSRKEEPMINPQNVTNLIMEETQRGGLDTREYEKNKI